MPPVNYRPAPNAPGYRVGDDGSVWSCLRRVRIPGANGQLAGSRVEPGSGWKRLKPLPKKNRYLQVSLRGELRSIHRLVLEAFVGPCPPGLESCHNDGDRANNRLGNLRWDTRKANLADRAGHGTACVGSRHGRAKLTERAVVLMRADRAAGMSYRELTRKYGVGKPTVSHVISRRTWNHV